MDNYPPPTAEPFCHSETITLLPDFERFHQANDIFSRGFWDEAIKTKQTFQFYRSFVKPQERIRPVAGFAQRDYALRNGPWGVTETLAELYKEEDRRDSFTDHFKPYRPPQLEPRPVADPAQMAGDQHRPHRV